MNRVRFAVPTKVKDLDFFHCCQTGLLLLPLWAQQATQSIVWKLKEKTVEGSLSDLICLLHLQPRTLFFSFCHSLRFSLPLANLWFTHAV